MKRTLTALALATGLLAASLPATAAGTVYGKGVQAKETVKVSDLIASPDKYVGKTISVEGLVTDVCSKRGCWMVLAGDKEFQTVRIKVDDGVIVFPMTAKGKKAKAEGVFSKIELDQHKATEYAKHLAEEAGNKFDPASVKGPMTIYQIKGTGAVID